MFGCFAPVHGGGAFFYVLVGFAVTDENGVMKKKLIKTAFTATLPVMAGYLVLGIGFGMVLKSRGFGIGWAFAMSFFIYAGSMQFVLIDLLTGGASLLTTALTTCLVNARHLFYSISMVDEYKGAGAKKPYMIFALTDETYSLACAGAPEGVNKHQYYFLVSLFDQIWWVSGSVLGGVLGSALHFNTEGIDFALTALFLTVFVEQWCSTKNHVPAIVGVLASLISLLIFGADSFLIPAMIAILVLLSFRMLKKPAKEERV